VSRLLRWENSTRPLIRVLYATTFGADGSGPWTEATYWNADPPEEVGSETSDNGIYFEECTRQALPGIGEAMLTMDYGTIDGVSVEPLDLLDKHIRIQAARRLTDETQTPEWRTIWVGRCEWQDDEVSPGSAVPRGRRVYRCVDLLRSYLAAYPMDRHANYLISANLAYGHPGYNYDRDTPNVAAGNKESTDAAFSGPDSTNIIFFGVNDAAASKTTAAWTDAESITNIMLLRRSAGDPIFDLDAASGMLDSTTPLPVNETDMAWDVMVRLLDRRRGKGIAFLDWEDDSADPTGALDVKLRVRPQLYDSLTYTYPAGSDVTVPGADADADYSVAVDLEGDQRVVDGLLTIRGTEDSAVDELITEGERIEVAVTVSGGDGTLAYRWSDELETAWETFDTAGDLDAAEVIYRPVLQYFGVKREAATNYKNGDNADGARADYWTDADGLLSIAHDTVSAPQMIEVMDDLPIYEGYNLTVPAESAAKDGKPRRMKPLVLVRTTSNRFITPKEYLEAGARVDIDADGIWCEWGGDEEIGARSIRGTYPGTSDRTITEASLTMTVGLRMPQRVRFGSAITDTPRRRRTIRIPDLHLWMGHPGAIWDLDRSTETDDGSNAKRIGGTIGDIGGTILRDDRAALARIHYLAWEWYRSDSGRRSATWAVRDCGLLPSWRDLAGTEIDWPRLGQVAKTIRAGGETYTLNTPISRVIYRNREGVTEWSTDWMEFDYGAA
jgi:hypothetical protein